MKFDEKILLYIFVLLLCIFGLVIGLYSYHEFIYKIHDEIKAGSGYSFTIGMSMEEALPIVQMHLDEGAWNQLSVFYDKGIQLDDNVSLETLEHFTFPLSEERLERLFSVDIWHITFGPEVSYFNSLELHFEKGTLVLIERIRSWEGP